MRRTTVPRLTVTLALFLYVAAATTLAAAQVSADAIWTFSGDQDVLPRGAERRAAERLPFEYSTYVLDVVALRQVLDTAPLEARVRVTDSPTVLTLPMPDGSFERFRIVESPILGPDVQARIPDYRSFLGQGIDDPTATIRFDLSERGFHGMGRTRRGSLWLDPWTPNTPELVMSAFRAEFPAPIEEFLCTTTSDDLGPITPDGLGRVVPPTGDTLHTYDLAITATNNYVAYFSGISGALSALATTVNRVNSIYERDVAIRFVLIHVQSWYPADDPFESTVTIDAALLAQNQTILDAQLGTGGYDIGHLVNAGGGGGLASVGACFSTRARGATSITSPVGDPWDVDYVSHEIGHQLGARHTFAGTEGSCSGNSVVGNRFEPGSGSTIMGYAGICGSQNIQPNSDAYFHVHSIEQIVRARDLVTCPTESATGNLPPVADAGPNGAVPTSTPFYLVGNAIDPDGDALTFTWEQMDDNAPLFRSLPPSASSTRFLPDAAQVLAGTSDPWEILPSAPGLMTFRVTARDNRAAGGGVDDDEITVFVAGDPFVVTSPNGGEYYRSCEPVTFKWNPGGSTTLAPTVRILLLEMATSQLHFVAVTANDGSETVEIPTDLTTGFFRAWIESELTGATGVRFYDVSNAEIAISGGLPNYAPWQPAGWADKIVPRNVDDATAGNVPLPTYLGGDSVTYVNWSYLNSQLVFGCDDVVNEVYVDDRLIATSTLPVPPETGYLFNNHAADVRGGRHTLWQVVDSLEAIEETNETDNGYARQWVWQPLVPVTFDQVSDAAPPRPNAGRIFAPSGTITYDNVDAYRLPAAGGNWVVVGLSSTEASADYDIGLYPQATDVESGYEFPLATSAAGAGATDAILINTRVTGVPIFDVGIRNSNAGTSGYQLERRHSGSDFLRVGEVAFDVQAFRTVWVDEFFVAPDELGQVTIEVLNVSTQQPVTLAVYDRQFGYGSIYDTPHASFVDANGRASITLDVTASGYYGVALFCDAKDGTQGFTFDWKVRDASIILPFSALNDGLPELKGGAAADWGDYDGDGDLDLAVSGVDTNNARTTRVYRNDAGTFLDAEAGLEPVANGSVAWGDVEGDGDLDLLVTGQNGSEILIARIYRNDDGVFTDASAGLTGAWFTSAEWGDHDGDGDLDILICGWRQNGQWVTTVYENDGGSFTALGTAIPTASGAVATWGDFDQDGDLDILQTGFLFDTRTRIFRNDAGSFVDSGAYEEFVNQADAAWGDYDGDGDLDFALTGTFYAGGTPSFEGTRVVRNDGGAFVTLPNTFDEVREGQVAWGDYDGDGDLDLLVTGRVGASDTSAKIYYNDAGVLRHAGPGLANLTSGTSGAAWGDFDADGDLDLFLAGDPGTNEASTVIYRNESVTPNAPPSTPTGLDFVRTGTVHTFSWDASTDDATPAAGLTYNLRIGTGPGTEDVFVTMSDPDDGHRRVARQGNVGSRRSVAVDLGDSSVVYWTVQAVDAGFAASAFAASQSTIVEGFVDIGAALEAITATSVAWGDYDGDGDPDVLLTGLTSTNARIARVYRNDAGSFVDIGAGLTGIYGGAVAWGDYDNDGDLDVLYTGLNASNVRIYRIYRNDGGAFVDVSNGLEGVSASSVAWGDYDNDGDLDILLTGRKNDLAPWSEVYRNDTGSFTAIGAGLAPAYESSGVWVDYDVDGDLDALIAGRDAAGVQYTYLYRNDGGAFTDVGAGLPGVLGSHFAWGDFDQDGDPDLLFTGATTDARVARIYRNDAGSFVDLGAGLEGVYDSCVDWGDYDNDGDLDVLLAGRTTTNARIARIYENDGGTFTDIDAGLVGVTAAAAHFGDFDLDGDLDVLIAGLDPSGVNVTRVYRNDRAVANTPPGSPSIASVEVESNVATFAWNAATDAQTPSAALTYNLRIGTTPGGNEIVSAMADASTGLRRLTARGNAEQNLSWSLDVSAYAGETLYWSVQAIDASHAGSAFAAEEILELRATSAPALPMHTALRQNHPNPFNPLTTIAFELDGPDDVVLAVYDVAGRLVRTLASGPHAAGRHLVVWDGTDAQGRRVSSGVYLYRLRAGVHEETRRMSLLK